MRFLASALTRVFAAFLALGFFVGPPCAAEPPPSRFPSGTPIRAKKIRIPPGTVHPYALLREARGILVDEASTGRNDRWSRERYLGIAYLQLQAGDRRGALISLRTAEDALRETTEREPAELVLMGKLFAASGERKEAARLAREAAQYFRETFDDLYVLQLLTQVGEHALARELVDKAVTQAKLVGGDAEARDDALRDVAELQIEIRDFAGAEASTLLFKGPHAETRRDEIRGKIVAGRVAAQDLPGAAATLRLIDGKRSDREPFDLVARAYVARKQYAAALEVAGRIGPVADERDATLLSIAEAQAAAGDIAPALATIDRIEFAEPKITALLAVAEAQLAKPDRPGAAQSVADAAYLVEQVSEHNLLAGYPFLTDVDRLLTLQRRLKFDKAAKQLAALIVRNFKSRSELDFVRLAQLAVLQRRTGDEESGLATLKLAVDYVAADRSADPKRPPIQLEAYLRFAAAQTEFGDRAGAQETLRRALPSVRRMREGKEVYEYWNAMKIAAAQVAAGDKARAYKTGEFALAEARKSAAGTDLIRPISALALIKLDAGDDVGAEALLGELGLPSLIASSQGKDDLRHEVVARLVRKVRTAEVLDMARKSGSIHFFCAIATELFRIQGLELKPVDAMYSE